MFAFMGSPTVTSREVEAFEDAVHSWMIALVMSLNLQMLEDSGWTAIAYAAVQKEYDIINTLLEKKADVTIPSKDPDNINVLDLMKNLNEHDVFDFLLEQYLIKSAKLGDIVAVQNMLKLSVNVEATEKDRHAWNALLWACYEGHDEIVQLLLEHKVNVNAKSSTGDSGISLATAKGFLNIVIKLLENGANPNSQTNSFGSPLLLAAEGNYPEIANVLLQRGAKSISNKAGISPLSQSCILGHFEVVKVLVENDSTLEINKPTQLELSPLQLVALGGYEDIAFYLEEHGAKLSFIKQDAVDSGAHLLCSPKQPTTTHMSVSLPATMASDVYSNKDETFQSLQSDSRSTTPVKKVMPKKLPWYGNIICLPQSSTSKDHFTFPYPRGQHRQQLMDMGLIVKICLNSSMNEDRIRKMIHCIFQHPMGNKFSFTFLQGAGKGRKTLIRSVSQSYEWTAEQVAQLGGQNKNIYILGHGDMPSLMDQDKPGLHQQLDCMSKSTCAKSRKICANLEENIPEVDSKSQDGVDDICSQLDLIDLNDDESKETDDTVG